MDPEVQAVLSGAVGQLQALSARRQAQIDADAQSVAQQTAEAADAAAVAQAKIDAANADILAQQANKDSSDKAIAAVAALLTPAEVVVVG